MSRSILVFSYLIFWMTLSAQNQNDNCENATDITPEIFHFDEWGDCNSIIGTLHAGFGLVTDQVDQPTVDAPVYSSQECIGYTHETTDHYPDLWYKTTFQEEGVLYYQQVFLNVGDTVQLSI